MIENLEKGVRVKYRKSVIGKDGPTYREYEGDIHSIHGVTIALSNTTHWSDLGNGEVTHMVHVNDILGIALPVVDLHLKPCPLCGSKDLVTNVHKFPDIETALGVSKGKQVTSICCPKCKLDIHMKGDCLPELSEKWNKRYIEENSSLISLYKDLGTIKWMGADEGWDLAIAKVRETIVKRIQGEDN